MAGKLTRQSGRDLLGVYLNDHLAGATGGTELARRMAAANYPQEAKGVLQRLAAEIAEDRTALADIMATLGVPVRGYKVWAAWIGEKAGRLKPNGYLLARSPLSNLEELEILRLAVEGKAAGWRTLRSLAVQRQLDSGRLDELLSRAHRQADELEELHAAATSHFIETNRAKVSDEVGVRRERDLRLDQRSSCVTTLRELPPWSPERQEADPELRISVLTCVGTAGFEPATP